MNSIADNLGTVTRRIQKATEAAGRPDGAVGLLAVTKTHPSAAIREAAAAGQYRFGENYLQEALTKMDDLADLPHLEWHFIGPIQSNKTRDIAVRFDWVHSVERLKIARRLSDQRPDTMAPLRICLQVNIDREASKSGADPDEAPALARDVAALPNLELTGLMAIPDPAQSASSLQDSFRRLARLLASIREQVSSGPAPQTLSMGMSGDLETAIAEGATLVRVGSALFGTRG